MTSDPGGSAGSPSGPAGGSSPPDRNGAPGPDREQLARILEAVSFAAGRLLVTENWEDVVDEVLRRLGRATDVSRLYVFENHRNEKGQLLASLRHEWPRPGVEAQIDNPELQGVPYEGTGFGRWREILSDRRIVSGGVDAFPEEELEASRTELERLALFDPLTGLPNRSLFEDRLSQALERVRRTETGLAVLFLDLDRFKVVNETLGHAAGEQLLAAVADRLRGTVRKHDTIARFGGDQFVGVVEAIRDEEQARVAVDRVAWAFHDPFRLVGTEIHVTASIGVALSSEELRDGDDLLRCAHVALTQSKDTEATASHLFDPACDEIESTRLHRENEIRTGLDSGEFVVHYQPVVEIGTGRIVGGEALARWDHPREGLLSPGAFLPLAEETGLVRRLDALVERTASSRMAGWREATGWTDLVVSVNLSTQHVREEDVVARVADALETSGLPPDALQIEITERTAMRGVGELARLRALGVRLAVDDFGRGYSSLEYLTRLDITTLKIDRSFVSGLVRDRRDTAVVESVVLLGRRLDLDVVAEGIETEEQREWLRNADCPHGQGYFFAAPVPPSEFESLLAAGELPIAG